MTTERERIDKMLAEGKVSAEEAERLRAALDMSERDETQTPPGQRDGITRPRLSRLALAGLICTPGAIVAALLMAAFAMVLTNRERESGIAVILVGLAVLLTGIGLSIGGLVVIRRAPGELAGRKLAHLGIWLPVVLIVALFAMSWVFVYLPAIRMARDRRHPREVEFEAELARERIQELWPCMRDILLQCCTLPADERPAAFARKAKPFLDPAWVKHLEAKGDEVSIDDTNDFKPLLQVGKLRDMRRSAMTLNSEEGWGLLVVTCGGMQAFLRLKRVGNEWRFERTSR